MTTEVKSKSYSAKRVFDEKGKCKCILVKRQQKKKAVGLLKELNQPKGSFDEERRKFFSGVNKTTVDNKTAEKQRKKDKEIGDKIDKLLLKMEKEKAKNNSNTKEETNLVTLEKDMGKTKLLMTELSSAPNSKEIISRIRLGGKLDKWIKAEKKRRITEEAERKRILASTIKIERADNKAEKAKEKNRKARQAELSKELKALEITKKKNQEVYDKEKSTYDKAVANVTKTMERVEKKRKNKSYNVSSGKLKNELKANTRLQDESKTRLDSKEQSVNDISRRQEDIEAELQNVEIIDDEDKEESKNIDPKDAENMRLEDELNKLKSIEEGNEEEDISRIKEIEDILANRGSGSKEKDEGGLYDYEIEEILKNVKSFKGVFSADELDKIGISPVLSFVLNLDNSDQKGSHWVAVYIDSVREKEINYFDSLADPPSDSFMRGIKKIVDKINPTHMLKMKINNVHVQKDTTDSCGFMAGQFILDRTAGKSFKEATHFKECKQADMTDKGEKRAKELKAKSGFGMLI